MDTNDKNKIVPYILLSSKEVIKDDKVEVHEVIELVRDDYSNETKH